MASSLHRLSKIITHMQLPKKPSLKIEPCMQRYVNESVILHSYPSGDITTENFRITKQTIDALNDGDILLEIQCISIDAYLRTTMYPPSGKNQLHESVRLGGKIHSLAIAKIVESQNRNYKIGEYVSGVFPIEKYTVLTKKTLSTSMLQRIVSPSGNPDDLKAYLTYLGIATGVSAYAGAYYVTKPIKKGAIAVVNAASGAVGSIVCQLYRNKGAKVIGITGGKDKKRYLMETLGLYQCIDYKSEDIQQKLSEYAPKGFDIAFDNVGGEQLDILLENVTDFGQIVLCGAVSQYSKMDGGGVRGPRNYMQLLGKNAEMKGFNVFPYLNKIMDIRKDLLRMVKNGTLVIKEVPVYGLSNFSVAMSRLLKGDKNGKILLYT